MNTQVIIDRFKAEGDALNVFTGAVVKATKNEEVVTIVVSQTTLGMSASGFLSPIRKRALVAMNLETYETLKNGFIPGTNYAHLMGQPFAALKNVDSLIPKYEGQSPRINPQTSEILLHKGQPIYRDTVIVFEPEQAADHLLACDVVPVTANTVIESVEFSGASIKEEMDN